MLRETLKTLLMAYGPSGNEKKVSLAIQALLSGHVDKMWTDPLGNLICERYGIDDNAKRLMISAHMDHIGLVVTAIEPEGFLRVSPVGGFPMNLSGERRMVFENGTMGILSLEPVENDKPGYKHLFIDIGADNREEAAKVVSVGDIAVYAPEVFTMGRNRIVSPAMDDRCACALLTELMRYDGEFQNTVIAVFSVQEEVGTRGAMTAAYALEPDLGLALDVTAWGDTPETKIPDIKLGQGPAVKIMDRSLIASPLIRDALIESAEAVGVSVQREVLPFGGTDGGAIQRSRAGVPTGVLSIPCRYVHSACETIDMRDMEGALETLIRFVDWIN